MASFIDLSIIAALLLVVVVLVLIVADNARWILAALAVQYILVAWLTTDSLPLTSSLSKLAAGLAVCMILGLSLRSERWEISDITVRSLPTGKPFRIFSALLVTVAAIGLGRSSAILALLEIPLLAAFSSCLLMAAALLLIGMFVDSFRVGAGLLVLLSGFGLLYSYLEPSLAVIALIASVHFGIAIVVSYLMYRERGMRTA